MNPRDVAVDSRHTSGIGRRNSLLAILVVAAGAAVRLRLYLAAWPFRFDELRVAYNLIERSFLGLVRPLDHGQSAPIGFLWLEKLALILFGTSEHALRLVPLLAGVASLPLLLSTGRRAALASGALIAALLMALSPPLVLRACDLKQYSTDVLATVLVLLAALPLLRPASPAGERRHLIALAAAGSAALFFSHPALFVVAAVGLALAADAGARRRWTRMGALAVIGGVWFLVLAILYVVNLRHLQGRDTLATWFGPDFMPWPPSAGDLHWYGAAFASLLASLGLTHLVLGAVMLALGAVRFLRRQWPVAVMLVVPILLAAVASAFRSYPFQGRLLTFTAPLLCLLIGAGFSAILDMTPRYRMLVGAIVVVPLAAGMIGDLFRLPRWGGGRYDIVTVLWEVTPLVEEDDLILVSGALRYPYEYYAARSGLRVEPIIVELPLSPGDPIRNLELASLPGHRAWLFTPHTQYAGRDESGDPRPATRAILDRVGTRRAAYAGANMSAMLYEFAP